MTSPTGTQRQSVPQGTVGLQPLTQTGTKRSRAEEDAPPNLSLPRDGVNEAQSPGETLALTPGDWAKQIVARNVEAARNSTPSTTVRGADRELGACLARMDEPTRLATIGHIEAEQSRIAVQLHEAQNAKDAKNTYGLQRAARCLDTLKDQVGPRFVKARRLKEILSTAEGFHQGLAAALAQPGTLPAEASIRELMARGIVSALKERHAQQQPAQTLQAVWTEAFDYLGKTALDGPAKSRILQELDGKLVELERHRQFNLQAAPHEELHAASDFLNMMKKRLS